MLDAVSSQITKVCSAVNLMMMVFCEAFGSRLTMKEYPESSEKQPVMFLTVKGLFFFPLFSFFALLLISHLSFWSDVKDK